jgi:hypothetical protein
MGLARELDLTQEVAENASQESLSFGIALFLAAVVLTQEVAAGIDHQAAYRIHPVGKIE